MALDLFCYATKSSEQATKILENVAKLHEGLFEKRFLISAVREIEILGEETVLKYDFVARCRFLIRVNDKDFVDLIPAVSLVLKNAFGSNNLLVLLENETLR